MKQKMFNICMWIGILCAIVVFMPNAHASSDLPASVKVLEGNSHVQFTETSEVLYVSANGQTVFNEVLLKDLVNNIYQLDALYESFVVEIENTGEVVHTIYGRNAIILKVKKQSNSYTLTFESNGQSKDILVNAGLKMYFVKSKEFTKPSQNLKLVVDVNHPIEIEALTSLFGAWDNYNGNITESIEIISDTYSNNMHTTGFYEVTIEASDEANNKSRLTYTVWVRDTEPPVVEPLADIYISYRDTLVVHDLLKLVVATDNYATELNYSLMEESYLGDERNVGKYFAEIVVDDGNGNSTTVYQYIYVIDDIAPDISGNTSYKMEVDQEINMDEVIVNLSAVDEKDKGVIDIYLISTDYIRFKVGRFTALFGAKDMYGNEQTVSVSIDVEDNSAPQFFIKIPRINVNADEQYEADKLLDMVEALLTIHYTDIKIVENEYIGNEDKPGVYQVKLSANTGSEWIEIHTQIRVNESTPIMDNIKEVKTHNYWIYITVGLTLIATGAGVIIYLVKKRRSHFN